MNDAILPLGKLPPALLAELLAFAPCNDPRVVLGPGIGLDCAVIDAGERLLVCKSDPVTFATDEIGHYLVQVNANDVATTGAVPRWLLLTLLLPQHAATAGMARTIMAQITQACDALDIALVGGHTEVTHGLDRPLPVGTLIGEVAREHLITPLGAAVGDLLLLTKGVPIEATSILAREFPDRLSAQLSAVDISVARNFLHQPGISVVRDARLAVAAGRVSAMHDPTEGGLAAALWELAQASGRTLEVDTGAVPVPDLCARVCRALAIDPLAAIASGALLLTVVPQDARLVCDSLVAAGIPCARIGIVGAGPAAVWDMAGGARKALPWPERDEIAQVFDS